MTAPNQIQWLQSHSYKKEPDRERGVMERVRSSSEAMTTQMLGMTVDQGIYEFTQSHRSKQVYPECSALNGTDMPQLCLASLRDH